MADESYKRGYDEETAGFRFTDNPYLQDSVEFRRWIDGYVKSMQDRREKADG